MANSFIKKIKELAEKLKPKPSIFNTKQEINEYDQAFKGERAKRPINKSDMSEIEDNLKKGRDQAQAKIPVEYKTKAEEPKVKPPKKSLVKKTLGTNLIQGEIVSYFDWKEATVLFTLFAVIGLAIVGMIYGGLLFWEEYKKGEGQVIIDGNIEQQSQIVRLEKDIEKIVRLQKKIKSAKTLLDNHVYWTNFFTFLENYTLSDIYYDNFKGDMSGSYSLVSHAPNYQALAQQVSAFRQDEKNVKEVSVMRGQSADNKDNSKARIDFTIDLIINPELFYK